MGPEVGGSAYAHCEAVDFPPPESGWMVHSNEIDWNCSCLAHTLGGPWIRPQDAVNIVVYFQAGEGEWDLAVATSSQITQIL